MTLEETLEVVNDIKFAGIRFTILISPFTTESSRSLQLSFYLDDTKTGKTTKHYSRKWLLSEHMTKSEIVQTALKAVLTVLEHEAREKFEYKGVAVFNPHINVESLHKLLSENNLDKRPTHD